ncbi:flavin-containing monooxygenase [Sphingomonas sp. GB1N7]|uniref:flavin-containing monooxygenase n=1 Tax=Parasphingomonas caseinilytica TaxID=3096158 RepID=UPI002FC5DD1A
MTSTLDLAALQKRYAQERDRRLVQDAGDRQYRDVEQGFAHLLDDPYGVAPPRAAVADEVDVFIVGGGFGGLLTAARLREAGVGRIRIADAGSDFGGTWYWNRYPGAACDIESYIYFPLLEETGYMPVERYSKAAEIRAHCQRIAKHYDLYRDALFSTQVKGLAWDGATARWTVTTDRGDAVRARFVVLTTGPLNRPKLPDIPGIDDFAGHVFHTSRWDYDYTGGSATEPMTKLANKRIGIIGTGATSVQCVPPLARDAEHLTVFQRTPSAIDARDNSATDPAWWASLPPGWQQQRMENFSAQFVAGLPADDLVRDGWTVMARAMRDKVAQRGPGADYAALHDLADFEKMQMTRDRVDTIVSDSATAEALKPWYSVYCKRPCFSDQYLQAFNNPNVTLVETGRAGVERITSNGAIVGGKEYPLDCLIFATGFDTTSSYAKRSGGMSITGVAGRTLNDKWGGGLSTLHGMHTRDFPNMFVISQAQAGMSPNFPHMISEQAAHIAHIVSACEARGIETVEPHEDAENDWVSSIVAGVIARRHILENCTPGYYNNEGRASASGAKSGTFAAGPLAFAGLLRDWREQGDFAGLETNGSHAREGNAA